MDITLRPIGYVRGGRVDPIDDNWDSVTAWIDLDTDWLSGEALLGLETFSHAEVIFHFHKTAPDAVLTTARHPRNNPDWPYTGIFAQRAHKRPNRLGMTTCHIMGVEGASVQVRGLDAIDGTPVLDIKPYMKAFAPRSDVREPNWTAELMAQYWRQEG